MAKRSKQQIDAETWAESGGTAGMFAALWRKGLLEIVEAPENGDRIVPKLK